MTGHIRANPPNPSREGWEQAAKEMAATEQNEEPWGELPLIIDSDDEEWKW